MYFYTTGYLIVILEYYIGLDKQGFLVYIKDMAIKILFEKSKFQNKIQGRFDKKEFVKFVSNQFKEISNKNLKIPVTLFHL